MKACRFRIAQLAVPISTVLVLCVFAGCRSAPRQPSGTGAKETAQRFFEAIVSKDWTSAYGLLTSESKGRVSSDQFAKMAQQYRQSVGFEPANVYITACEEHGREAMAHVTISGKGAHRSRFKDAIPLKSDGTWGVSLPSNFGRVGG